jgi:phosphoglucomutase
MGTKTVLKPLATAGPSLKEILVDVARLEQEYYAHRPDDPTQRVSIGTRGHRGSPLRDTFTESHSLTITPAIWDRAHGTKDPPFAACVLKEMV